MASRRLSCIRPVTSLTPVKRLSWLVIFCGFLGLRGPVFADDLAPVLSEGTPILTPQNKWVLCLQSNGAQILTYDRASISSGPIVQARITEVLKKDLWRTSCDMPFTNAISRGDVVLITGRVRTMETTNASGRGFVRSILRVNEKPYERRFVYELAPGKSWERFYVPLKLDFAIPPKLGVLIFGLGYARQMVELCDVQIYRFPADFDMTRLPATEFSIPSR